MTFTEFQGNVGKSLCSNDCALETSFLVVVCNSRIGMFLRPQLHCHEYFNSWKISCFNVNEFPLSKMIYKIRKRDPQLNYPSSVPQKIAFILSGFSGSR